MNNSNNPNEASRRNRFYTVRVSRSAVELLDVMWWGMMASMAVAAVVLTWVLSLAALQENPYALVALIILWFLVGGVTTWVYRNHAGDQR